MDGATLKRMEQMAKRFRAMSDPTRLQILAVMGDESLSVQDICDRTGFKQSNVSKHLRVLREIAAIACEQRSYYHYYHVIDPYLLRCWRCTKTTCNQPGGGYFEENSAVGSDIDYLDSAIDPDCHAHAVADRDATPVEASSEAVGDRDPRVVAAQWESSDRGSQHSQSQRPLSRRPGN